MKSEKIVLGCVVIFSMILACCAHHKDTTIRDYDVCGIDSAYIADSIHADTIIKTDINGNPYTEIAY